MAADRDIARGRCAALPTRLHASTALAGLVVAGDGRGTLVVLTPIIRGCAVASMLLLAGCGSSTPSWNFLPSLSGGTSVSLTIESDPPGADAKTSLGPTCRTPCILPVPADREFTVSYTLDGYAPQIVTVTPHMPERNAARARDGRRRCASGTVAEPGLCTARSGLPAAGKQEGQGAPKTSRQIAGAQPCCNFVAELRRRPLVAELPLVPSGRFGSRRPDRAGAGRVPNRKIDAGAVLVDSGRQSSALSFVLPGASATMVEELGGATGRRPEKFVTGR